MVFGRRKRSASAHYQPLSTPAAQSAQSAASHAFLRSQPSAASLSSAAAAAALRNSTPTPTPIENVQTKRMMQRRVSTQSQVNPVGGRRSASMSDTLRRSSSNSSMSARTFREQSPHRPATSSGPVSPPLDVPPLPSVPTQFVPRKNQNRRAMSMEPSMRLSPSSPPRAGTRAMDRQQGRGSPIQIATHERVTSLGTVPELERAASRNSVNFSYPMGSRPTSPIAMSSNNSMTLDGAIQETIAEVGEKPTKETFTAQPSGSLEGSPVANKSGPLAGTAATAAAQAVSAQHDSPTANFRARKVQYKPEETDSSDQYTDNAIPVVARGGENEHPSSRALPDRWPSTVRADIPKIPDPNIEDLSVRQSRTQMASVPSIADHIEIVPLPPSPPSELQIGDQPQFRQSSSPGRSTRFSRLLSVADASDHVHEPPPRSVSPVKSALKHPRGTSTSPDRRSGATGQVLPPSELSDGTSVASDEGLRTGGKKKSVKVSFDDEAEVVGVAASPPTSPDEYIPESPPCGKTKSRMSWLGVGKKKSLPDFASDDDWDVVMKPRQVLPSFGSIRGSRGGGLQRSPIPDFSDNESSSSSESDVESKPNMSFSNDHAVGSILPNIHLNGQFQPRDVSALEQLSVSGTLPTSQAKTSPKAEPSKLDYGFISGIDKARPYAGVSSDLAVPAIAVEPATPPADEIKQNFDPKRSSMDQFRIPGGFPPSGSDRSIGATAKKTNDQTVASTVPKLDDVDTGEESGDSVYSDAPEDIDGDGFGSINAIVDRRSPPRSTPTLEVVSESRDATPKPLSRVAVVDNLSEDVTEQPLEEVRSTTPTQDSVNRLVSESAASSIGHGFDSAYQPVPIKLQARNAPAQNGSVQAQRTTQTRPMSVDVNGASRMQDPRWSSNDTPPRGGKNKPRPMSVGPAFHKSAGQPGFPSTLRRTRSSGSDSSSSFKRSSPRGDPHTMRRTMRAGAAGTNVRVQSPTERNESPLEHRPLSSGSSNGTMRKTLRGPAAGERYSFFSTNKKSPPRAKFTKPPPRSARGTRFVDSDGEDEPRPQVFASRFADSSDEDEPRNNVLRPVRGIPRRQGADDGDSTELDDSSEEGPGQQAQPVRASNHMGSPPGSRGKSSQKNAPNMSGMAAVAKQRGMSQRDLEEFLMAPPRGRPGLLTRLGLKKSKNSEHIIRKADAQSPSRTDMPLERSRMEREHLRSESMLNGNYGTTITTVSAENPLPTRSSSKLVKRNSKRLSTGPDAWPLRGDVKQEEPLQPVAEQSRGAQSSPVQAQDPAPSTADAAAPRNETPVVNGHGAHGASPIEKEPEAPRGGPNPNNDSTSEITNPEEHGMSARDVVITGSGRKKRFPLLRKAFGLRN
ncbi:hypothetical protein N7457_001538 [Penicillium paradoxum]|uniref:uncharacterized protein n=1 Tax=Penicillium paradoxum TaxID=176176 RepID=UPI0025495698|nr:uncharacterized protein N7457_001538 [Penicillium paradoxum]KAJ5794939.1 hypothetical protein N7457_001538 [Penicillium paradoxum]